MLDDAFSGQGQVGVRLPTTDFAAVPGSRVPVRVLLLNRADQDIHAFISVRGIPSNWVSIPAPVVQMAKGEQREVILNVQPPPAPQARAGRYPFAIRVASQNAPDQIEEVEGVLTVAALAIEGRIGLLMASTEFAVVPGGRTIVPIVLRNQGLEEDVFQLSVEGIPTSWLSTATPTTRLSPGQQREVELAVQPSRSARARVGRHRIRIQAQSQAVPAQMAEAECILTVAAFVEFSASLQPQRMEAGQPVWVTVENQGNIQETFTVGWTSPSDALVFEPRPVQQLRVSPGEVGTVEVRAAPRRRPIFGGQTTRAFTARVESAEQETRYLNGEVISRALLPTWVIPLFVLLALAVVAVALLIPGRESDEAAATRTAAALLTPVAETPPPTLAASAVPTEAPTEMSTELPSPAPTVAPTDVPSPTEESTETPTGVPTQAPTEAPTETPTEVPTETPTEVPTEVPTVSPAPPPIQDTGNIAFESDRDGNAELYTLSTTDWTTFRLTIDPAIDSQSAWSPDGTKIAFATNRDGNFEIYVMNADGTAAANLTNDPSDDLYPTWSPDGEWIAFTTDRDGNQEIYVVRTDGSDLRNLTNNASEDYQPTWYAVRRLLSTSEQIAFTSDRDGNAEIYAMNTDGSDQVNLTNNAAQDLQPSWASNGERLAFTSDRDGNQEIYVMDADGTNTNNLTNNPAADVQATWSPGDQWIAFVTDRDGNQEVYVIPSPDQATADEFEPFNATNNPAEERYPAWVEPEG